MFEYGDNVNLTLLNTEDTISRLLSLIKSARKEVWLVSPYITLGGEDRVGQAIQAALTNKVSVTVVFRFDDIQSFARTFNEHLRALTERGLRIYVLPKLHAKLYWSESEVIISSLNLLSSSFLSTIEVGLWSQDPADVAWVQEFFNREIQPHFLTREDLLKRAGANASEHTRTPRSAKPIERSRSFGTRQGVCIRCAVAVDFDPDKPYCWDDYQKWAEYGNPDYEDSYCHGCGKDFPATMNKPLCRNCYRKVNS